MNAYAKRQMGKIEKEKMWSHSTKSRNVQRKEKCWEVQKKIIKRKDLKKDQNQNKNPSYDKKWSLIWSP